jgi:FkbM family methyltransferase
MTLQALQAGLLRSHELHSAYQVLRGVPGLGSALHSAAERVFPSDVVLRIPSGLAEGMLIQLDPRFHTEQGRGTYEPWMQQLLLELLRAGDSFCDVGARIGFFALGAARLVGESGRVIALEPDPSTYSRLVRNVELNGLIRVRKLNVAAWSSSGELAFSPSAAASGGLEKAVTTRLHLMRTPSSLAEGGRVREHPPEQRLFPVQGTPLDRMVGRPPDVVKVDVEGGETEVLRGARALLHRRLSTWLIEAHGAERLREVVALLSGSGYAPRVVREEASSMRGDRYFVVARP